MATRMIEFEKGSMMEGMYDAYLGLVVGISHSYKFAAHFVKHSVVRKSLRYLGFDMKQTLEGIDASQGLRVIGVGYGRTGTYSLTLALEELGFPTLHTQHLYEHVEIFDMWTDNVFLPSIKDNKVTMGEPDFDMMVKHGFQATTDLPMALYFEEVHERYPDCKFILTTRKSSEIWFKSWDTLTKSITQPARYGGKIFTSVHKISKYLRWLFTIVNKDTTYLKAPFPLPDQNKEQAISSYEEHNRRVREVIPPHLLLEYSVEQGWDPLCNFLEIQDCPARPFPKSNSAISVQVQSISSFIVPLILVLFCIFYLFSFTFQRATGRTVLSWVNVKLNQLLHRVVMGRRKVQPVAFEAKEKPL
eukprot:CAMPEP_0118687398 /NCGR_PEP_ID=MMETSP0800-20121206/8359_1 /TAXON_ID=210618 ORGANISM="Striatella unipunctata, Strain CCMP2910" /NCGR_SAMPLE_ID=MMETSP0800 /ASSEMBLY_ACC=CAM_ASM_000638 /LENGTH=358 /DNA_ID=CAMNT_0006584575 /DNA_START=167 /DNA_END=1243 /DNA_ORIENTATION=-